MHLPFHILLFSLLPLASSTCYFPNGSADASGKQAACNTSGHSMCCLTNVAPAEADTCRSDGLCIPSDNIALFRDTCTDSTWQDPACLRLCMVGTDDAGNKSANVYMPLTQCADGSLCCGLPNINEGQGITCCKQKEGVWIQNDKIVSTKPATATATSQSTQSAALTTSSLSRSSPSPSPSPFPSPSPSSSTNTGAVVGGVVGGVAAIAILAFGFWYFLLRRSLRQRMNDVQANGSGYEQYGSQDQIGEEQHKRWTPGTGMPMELANGPRFRSGELDASGTVRAPELDGLQTR